VIARRRADPHAVVAMFDALQPTRPGTRLASVMSMPTAQPTIVTQQEWLGARMSHLAHEKEMTKQLDRLRAERRRLPMVKLDKDYTFHSMVGSNTIWIANEWVDVSLGLTSAAS